MSDHHHKETFITKYIFSQDHKMIAKQFLLTGIFMALVGMLMSAMFRVQLANPGETSILYNLMPSNWMDPDTGALLQDKYLALVTMHGTILVFWVLTAGLSGTFANFKFLYKLELEICLQDLLTCCPTGFSLQQLLF